MGYLWWLCNQPACTVQCKVRHQEHQAGSAVAAAFGGSWEVSQAWVHVTDGKSQRPGHSQQAAAAAGALGGAK